MQPVGLEKPPVQKKKAVSQLVYPVQGVFVPVLFSTSETPTVTVWLTFQHLPCSAMFSFECDGTFKAVHFLV